MPPPLTISCSSKSRLVLPEWFCFSGAGLPRIVLEKRLLNECSSSNSTPSKVEQASKLKGYYVKRIIKRQFMSLCVDHIISHLIINCEEGKGKPPRLFPKTGYLLGYPEPALQQKNEERGREVGWEKVACWSTKAAISLKHVNI